MRLGREFLAHDLFGLELGAVVGELELLAGIEHVFAEDAVVATGDGDRADVVEGRVSSELARRTALIVPPTLVSRLIWSPGGDVVDGTEVKEVVDALDPLAVGFWLRPRCGSVMSPVT